MQKKTLKTNLKVVIINYFFADLIFNLIEQIRNTCPDSVSLSITCADNSVDDSQREQLESYKKQIYPELELSFNQNNLGFGRAINNALKNASFDHVLLINPDVTLLDNSIENLLKAALSSPKHGIWGGITLSDNHQPDLRHAWRSPSLLRTVSWAFGIKKIIKRPAFIDNYSDKTNEKTPYHVDVVSGCFMLISSDAWKKINGFDERFFLYSEEVDLCYRAIQQGFNPVVIPNVKLEHATSYDSKNTARLALLYKAKFIYFDKHHNSITSICYRLITAIGATIRACSYLLLKADTKSTKSWLNVCFLSLSFNQH